MPNSIGDAYAILKGYHIGDPQEAQSFLQNMNPTERLMRNRNESRLKSKRKKRNPLAPKLGGSS